MLTTADYVTLGLVAVCILSCLAAPFVLAKRKPAPPTPLQRALCAAKMADHRVAVSKECETNRPDLTPRPRVTVSTSNQTHL